VHRLLRSKFSFCTLFLLKKYLFKRVFNNIYLPGAPSGEKNKQPLCNFNYYNSKLRVHNMDGHKFCIVFFLHSGENVVHKILYLEID
jgi:hypothetical protein